MARINQETESRRNKSLAELSDDIDSPKMQQMLADLRAFLDFANKPLPRLEETPDLEDGLDQ